MRQPTTGFQEVIIPLEEIAVAANAPPGDRPHQQETREVIPVRTNRESRLFRLFTLLTVSMITTWVSIFQRRSHKRIRINLA